METDAETIREALAPFARFAEVTAGEPHAGRQFVVTPKGGAGLMRADYERAHAALAALDHMAAENTRLRADLARYVAEMERQQKAAEVALVEVNEAGGECPGCGGEGCASLHYDDLPEDEECWVARLQRAEVAARELLAAEREPGDLIAAVKCPCCGAALEVLHGDDEGQIGVLGTRRRSECEGAGRCHGTQRWCDECGDVSRTCDTADCDAHPLFPVPLQQGSDAPAPPPTSEAASERRALTFRALREANVRRCEESFHSVDCWNLLEWAGAMAGEAGEAANVAKKLRRGDYARDHAAGVRALADELADVIAYADLLAERAGIDLAGAVATKFNAVSQRVASSVVLPLPEPEDLRVREWPSRCRVAEPEEPTP